jgi:hypothetical protein
VKRILVASIVALVVVGGLGLYSLRVIGEASRRGKELEAQLDAASKALLETDARFPREPLTHLDAVRFPAWLEVRNTVAREIVSRAADPSARTFHAKEMTNELLVLLRKDLDEHKMGFGEYRDTARRWRELLALPEFEELRRSWRIRTAGEGDPEGLPLPAPAKDAQAKEIEQVRRYARLLEDSMDADRLDPTLDGIGKGPGEG